MLRVNLSDGRTESFDLDAPEDRERWHALRAHTDQITGVSFVVDRHHYAFPFPRKFANVRLDAQPIEHRNGKGAVVGYVITAYADNVRAELVVYRGKRPRMARFTLERAGRPVFIPSLDG